MNTVNNLDDLSGELALKGIKHNRIDVLLFADDHRGNCLAAGVDGASGKFYVVNSKYGFEFRAYFDRAADAATFISL